MSNMIEALPGIERIKTRFLDLLEERQSIIASHALAAWDSQDTKDMHSHLTAAQSALHQIAGSAGSLGFAPLGQAARECENEIIVHLENQDNNGRMISSEVMSRLDTFVSMSQTLLAKGT